MATDTDIDRSIQRIRGWRAIAKWSVGRFAKEAGLTESTLRFLETDNWNPTAETLRKLEAVIPSGWQPGDPVPNAEGAAA